MVRDTERLVIWCETFYSCSQGLGIECGLVVAPARKRHSCALSLTASSVEFSWSLPCFPQSRYNYLAFRTSILLRLLLDLVTYVGVDPLGVSSISKESCGLYSSKIKHNLSWAHPSGIVSGVLAVY